MGQAVSYLKLLQDGLWVKVDDVLPFLNRFIDNHSTEKDAIIELATLIGCDESTIRKWRRHVVTWITADLADRIALAIDQPHILTQIQMYPNPRWSRTKYEAWRAEQGLNCFADDIHPNS